MAVNGQATRQLSGTQPASSHVVDVVAELLRGWVVGAGFDVTKYDTGDAVTAELVAAGAEQDR